MTAVADRIRAYTDPARAPAAAILVRQTAAGFTWEARELRSGEPLGSGGPFASQLAAIAEATTLTPGWQLIEQTP